MEISERSRTSSPLAVDPLPLSDVASALLDELARHGVTHCFLVPGATIAALGAAVAKHPEIHAVLAAHETGAVFMADGFARVTGRPALALVTGGPGGTNAATGVAVALADHVPLVLLSGHSPLSANGRGLVQESSAFGVDLVRLFEPITLSSSLVASPSAALRTLRGALAAATGAKGGPPGPVHLAVPADLAAAPIAPAFAGTDAHAPAVSRAAVAKIHALLATAKRPVLLVGSGVVQAGAAALLPRVAERFGVCVATSPRARGAFPETHARALGVCGYGMSRETERFLCTGDVDVLVAIGTSLGESSTNLDARLAPTRAFVHVDLAPAVDRWPITLAVQGDASDFLEQLLELPAIDRAAPLPLERPRAPCVEAGHPARVIDAIERVRARDEVVVSDAGSCFWWLAERATFDVPRTFLMNLGAGSMGYAVGAAIGASLGKGGARTWAVLGDAALLMCSGDVHTAVEENLPIVWVVLNDGGHGMVRHGERLAFGATSSPVSFARRIDAAALGRSLGARGISATTATIDEALREARAADGPVVVDVAIDPAIAPPLLAKRVELVRALQRASKEGAKQ